MNSGKDVFRNFLIWPEAGTTPDYVQLTRM
jgi:hypothetical protein